jgi:hypothetical protein
MESVVFFIADHFLALTALFTVLFAAAISYFTHRKATDRNKWKRDFRQTMLTIGGACIVLFVIMQVVNFLLLLTGR